MLVRELLVRLGFKVDPTGARQFDANIKRLHSNAETAALGITRFMRAAAASTAAAFSVKTVAMAGDTVASSTAKIESSIGRSATSAEEAAAIHEELYQVSRRTGVATEENAAAFTRFNLAMQDLGRPASDTVSLIEGIQSAAIVAGVTTTELTNTMAQLGQALGSGKLSGDELKTMRESMPRFLRDITKELGITSEQFFEQAEKGMLTPARLIPAMLKASAGAREELANFPLGMARSFATLRSTANGFLAELDKQLGLSKLLTAWFERINKRIEHWRKNMSGVGKAVDRLGGLPNILEAVAYAIGIAGAAMLIFNRALQMSLLYSAGWIALAALIGGAAALLQDFVKWVRGNTTGTMFGHWFGDFQTLIAPVKKGIADIKAWFASLPDWISGVWTNIVSRMGPQIQELVNMAAAIRDAFALLGPFFTRLFDIIGADIMRLYNALAWVARKAKELLPSMEGEGTGSDPATQEEKRKRMGTRGALPGFPGIDELMARPPDVTGSLPGATSSSVAQTNHINNQIAVTAPGADPASVASASQQGVNRATDQMVTRLNPELARGINMANPRVEPAVQ